MSDTQFGHFDDISKEYVITDPATPWPWINYLGNDGFFSLISQTAGGYCFCRDAKFRRILRYRYNGVPMDAGGRYFYINEGGCVWSPSWKPVRTPLDFYECRHGMGYTRICGEKNGLNAEVLFFVPLDSKCEIHKLTLSNRTEERKSFKLFSFVEWCLWNAATDMENFQRNLSTGEVEIHASTIYHKTEYKERRNHYAFYSVNSPIDGFDTDRESFLGAYNGFDAPEAVMKGEAGNSVAHGWSPIASHCKEISLDAGESCSLIFILGYVENPQEEKFTPDGQLNRARAEEMIARFDSCEKTDRAFRELGLYWENLLGRFRVSTPDPKVDRTVNIWNQYQCMVTFNMSRSASFFESGIGRGMGFRDSNQDLVGFVHQIPERARERILDIASTQFPDGACYHQYQPLTKRGNNDIGSGFNDDPLWLIFGTVAYLKETGDFGILAEPVPFDNRKGSERSLMHHLKVSFDHVINTLGPHGLPLIGRADWNDCLNLNCFSNNPNESFQTTENKNEGSKAESLMIAGQFVFCGRQYEELCRHLAANEEAAATAGQDAKAMEAEADRVAGHVKDMSEAVERYGWDGEWYLRAYDYFGNKVGSNENEEGKIFIESQGWCGMAGIGREKGMVEKALDSVKERLDCEHGIVLNNPAFTRYVIEYGEISSYPAGYKENAGIFCHNNPWVIIAEVLAGRGADAWEHWRKICPAYIKDQKLHKVEPYVYSQMVAGKDAAKPGEAKNSWLTGTAAWNWFTVSEYLLGVRPQYDGLELVPCIPDDWDGFCVHRSFRDAEYEIRVSRSGERSLTLDGKNLGCTAIIPYSPGKHTVSFSF